MTAKETSHGSWVPGIRWLALVIGAILFLFVVGLEAAEGLGALAAGGVLPELTFRDGFLIAAMLAMLAGLVLAWLSGLWGGFLLVAGFLGFTGTMFATRSPWNPGWFLALFPLLGLVHILCWLDERRHSGRARPARYD